MNDLMESGSDTNRVQGMEGSKFLSPQTLDDQWSIVRFKLKSLVPLCSVVVLLVYYVHSANYRGRSVVVN